MAEYDNSVGEDEQVVYMARNSSSDREGGVFNKVKSRLGFGNKDADDRDYDNYGDYDDNGYDDYDDEPASNNRDWDRRDRDGGRSSRSSRYNDYDDYGNYDDGYSSRGSRYDDRGSRYDDRGSRYDDRGSRYDDGGTRYAPIDSPYSTHRSGGDMPSLVTREDIKMSTPLPEIPPIEPINEDGEPYAAPQYGAASDTASQRGDSLDSLFGSNTASGVVRTLKVIKPVSIEDAEGVTRGIKTGSVVVLALRNTPDDLAKRILDFSFGAASALDASVECPGEKVFAIAKGRALGDAEKMQLRNQGVL